MSDKGLMTKMLKITKAVQRRAATLQQMTATGTTREHLAELVRQHLLQNKILILTSIKDSSREQERTLKGLPSRVHVRVCITLKDIDSGDADWRDWHGEALVYDGDGLLSAVENATDSFLLATFGLHPIQPEAAATTQGNGRPPANSYKNRNGEFLTLLAKKLKEAGRLTNTDDMRKLVEQAETNQLLKPEMTYQQAVETVMRFIQSQVAQ